MVKRTSQWLLAVGVLAGCNVSPSSEGTGGLGFGAGSDGGGGSCPRALVVVGSDYTSTNISVISPHGVPLSRSIISSASAAPGLTTALSGDVAVPSARPASGSLVLLDRTTSVLTWVDPVTGTVQRQLAAGTGFAANPHDYVELGANKAYVTRYATNASPGMQPNDGGGDVLIIDPSAPVILGRVDMALADDGPLLPRPSRLVRMGDQVWVTLERSTAPSFTPGDARLAALNVLDDSIAWTLDLPGAQNCSGLAVSPSSKVVALACAPLGAASSVATSTVVLLDATTRPPVELKRIAMSSLGAPVGSALSFYTETRLVGVAYGDLATARNDVLYTLDTVSEVATQLGAASAPFSFGDLSCAPGCTEECVIADSSTKQLQVWGIQGPELVMRAPFIPDTAVSLPPRSLGAL